MLNSGVLRRGGRRVHPSEVVADRRRAAEHEAASPEDDAAICVAGEVWVEEIRHLEFPDVRDADCREDRRMAGLADDFGARLASATARRILRERGADVLRLADRLEKAGRVVFAEQDD